MNSPKVSRFADIGHSRDVTPERLRLIIELCEEKAAVGRQPSLDPVLVANICKALLERWPTMLITSCIKHGGHQWFFNLEQPVMARDYFRTEQEAIDYAIRCGYRLPG